MDKNDNNFTTTVRIKLSTYHKLDKLVQKKKRKNLSETGKVGDADFDGIITDLLKNNIGGGDAAKKMDTTQP